MPKQFSAVDCSRGAPMGRISYGDITKASGIRLFKVNVDSGGYDDGGAYWGLGKPLYCAVAEDTSESMQDEPTDARAFVRADSREDAMALLNLKPEQLKRK